jgi:hypothetical protein
LLGWLLACVARAAHFTLSLGEPLNHLQQPQPLGSFVVVEQFKRAFGASASGTPLRLMYRLLDDYHGQRRLERS